LLETALDDDAISTFPPSSRHYPGLVPRVCVGRRRGELIAGDRSDVIRAWHGHAAPSLLRENCGGAEHHVIAMVARHARGCIRVVARSRSARLRLTPCFAQQRGAWPNRHCQHDGKCSCSKHVMLGWVRWQEGRQRHTAIRSQEQVVPPSQCCGWARLAGFPHPGAENPAAPVH
jgi:hypothetical protein